MKDNLEQRITAIISHKGSFPSDYRRLSDTASLLHSFAKTVADKHTNRTDLLDWIVRIATTSREDITFTNLPPGYDETKFFLRKTDLLTRLEAVRSLAQRAIDINQPYHGIILSASPRYELRAHTAQILSQRYGHAKAFTNIPYFGLKTGKDTAKILADLKKGREIRKENDLETDIIHTGRVYLPPSRRKPSTRAHPYRHASELWNLANIGTYAAQQETKGRDAIVAVIDTGIDYTHVELQDRFNPQDRGWNYVDNDNNIMDKDGHGTHVSGTIAGKTCGIAPEATLKACVVLDESGSGYEIDIMYALDDCITEQVNAVNMSLGSNSYNPAFEQLCEAASKRGVLIAAAAGNDGNHSYNYPAAYNGVLAVAALDRNNTWLAFSNANDAVDLAAPGGDILSSVPGGYAEYSGTSMASPHVAGSLALLCSVGGEPSSLFEIIKGSTQHLAYPPEKVGTGLVRPDQALTRLLMPAGLHASSSRRY